MIGGMDRSIVRYVVISINSMITHYDLFAGIGGFSYALDTIFNEQENEHIFCEWEQFPTAVLKKHWPDATYYGDIADLVADTTNTGSKTMHKRQKPSCELTILTGGFPCQPFSHAGRRKGTSDDRYKWPEMFAVIRNVRPDWIIAENVRGLASWNDGMVLETVCADLESEGYEVRPYIIPACSVGAPHRRERVWIVANYHYARSGTSTSEVRSTDWKTSSEEWQHSLYGAGRQDRHIWSEDWRKVALATCHDGVDDGLPRKLDGATLRGKRTDTISASKHRQERLKACGNAIVPQVAMEIFTSIKKTNGIPAS